MADYLYALAADPAPQTIPRGFGDLYDWDAIDDDEKARRGWVRPAPPVIDPAFERLAISFAQDDGGFWRATYSIVPGDIATALAAAYDQVAARRYTAEVGGFTFAPTGQFIPSDREMTRPTVEGAAARARANPEFEVEDWKLGPGLFVTLDNATLIALGDAMVAHVQACFSRESAISRLLAGKKKADTLRATLAAEINQGWPA